MDDCIQMYEKFRFLFENNRISVAEIAKHTNRSRQAVNNYVNKMKWTRGTNTQTEPIDEKIKIKLAEFDKNAKKYINEIKEIDKKQTKPQEAKQEIITKEEPKQEIDTSNLNENQKAVVKRIDEKQGLYDVIHGNEKEIEQAHIRKAGFILYNELVLQTRLKTLTVNEIHTSARALETLSRACGYTQTGLNIDNSSKTLNVSNVKQQDNIDANNDTMKAYSSNFNILQLAKKELEELEEVVDKSK